MYIYIYIDLVNIIPRITKGEVQGFKGSFSADHGPKPTPSFNKKTS